MESDSSLPMLLVKVVIKEAMKSTKKRKSIVLSTTVYSKLCYHENS